MFKIRHKPPKAKLAIKNLATSCPKAKPPLNPNLSKTSPSRYTQQATIIGCGLSLVVACHWLWLVIGCGLSLVVACHWLRFAIGYGLLDFDWLD